jgi:serine/threonine protein kinase
MISQSISSLNEMKRQAEVSMGLMKTKNSKLSKDQRRKQKALLNGELPAKVAMEQEVAEKKRLEALRKQAERERAWFTAHPHKFLRMKNQKHGPTFCIICKEKAFEYWCKVYEEEEKKRAHSLANYYDKWMAENEALLIEMVSDEYGESLMQQAKQEIEEILIVEGLVEDIHHEKDAITAKLAAIEEEKKLEVESEYLMWEQKMKKITDYFKKKGYPLFDSKGRRILASKAPKNFHRIDVKSHKSDDNNVETEKEIIIVHEEEIVIPHTVKEYQEQVDRILHTNAMRLVVYHRSETTKEKDVCLGYIEFKGEDLIRVSKGFRAFKLKALVNHNHNHNHNHHKGQHGSHHHHHHHQVKSGSQSEHQEVTVTGSLAVMLRMTTVTATDRSKSQKSKKRRSIKSGKDHVENEVEEEGGKVDDDDDLVETVNALDIEEVRYKWKVTLKKLSKIFSVSPEQLSNPFIEVYWQGEMEKHKKRVLFREWVLVGQTKTKYATIDCEYNHKEHQDDSVFELPPIWTDYPIPGRGPKETDIHSGGGYVAKNIHKAIETTHLSNHTNVVTKSGKEKPSFGGVQANVEEIRNYRVQQRYQELLGKEVAIALEGQRHVLLLEEKERWNMGKEEKYQRSVEWENERSLYAPDLLIQENFALMFQRLLEIIVEASPLLSRLRFLMGESEQGNQQDDESEEDAATVDKVIEEINPRQIRKNSMLALEAATKALPSNQLLPNLFPQQQPQQPPQLQEQQKLLLSRSTSSIQSNVAAAIAALQSQQQSASMPMPAVGESTVNVNDNGSNSTHKHHTIIKSKRKYHKEGSGMRILCEDPSTGDMVRVIITPIINKDDESTMLSQALLFAGQRPTNLVRIIESAIHEMRTYNATGFTAVYEKRAVTIMEYVEGPLLSEYLFHRWEEIDNRLFRSWLADIAESLTYLHQDGLLHRNLSAKAFILEKAAKRQERRLSAVTAEQWAGGQRGRLNFHVGASMNVRIQDYWFLENPRRVQHDAVQSCQQSHSQQTQHQYRRAGLIGSSSSQRRTGSITGVYNTTIDAPWQAFGRGEWGSSETAPPEVLSPGNNSNNMISDKSDIFSLGVCIFYWSTKGLTLPAEYYVHGNMDLLRKYLPLKWKSWLLITLKMCLALNPQRRASAQELMNFLKSSRNSDK